MTREEALAHAFHNVYVSAPITPPAAVNWRSDIVSAANERRIRIMYPQLKKV